MANSSSSASQRYKRDVSHKISEKIDLFYRQEQLIFAFESQLNDLKAQHRSLEQELQPYRIEAHSNGHKMVHAYGPKQAGSIHGLPDEILSHIFKIYTDDPSNTRRSKLRILLLVCKRWHGLVMKSPLLWACIEVDEDCELFEFGGSLITTYIEACISHSQSIPLDIDLALRGFDFSGYIKAGLFDRAKAIVDEEFHQNVYHQIHKLPWDHRSSRFLIQFGRFFDNLFGDDGQHLKRCHKLNIRFPLNEEIARTIWVRLWSNMSNLTSLTLYGIPTPWSNDDALAQVNFPRLKYLEVRGVHILIAYPIILFSVSPTELEHFSTVTDCSITHLEELSTFQNLRLNAGQSPLKRKLHFDFPALKILRVSVSDGYQRLPVHLSPEWIEWSLRYREFIGGHEYLIQDILLLSNRVRKIQIPRSQKAAVLGQVRKHRDEGAIPLLSQIIVDEDDYELEVIDVQDIV